MQSFLGWIGGKSALRNAILNRFPDKVGRYIEVFGGAGWVLFGRDPVPGQMEVFNDADGELINIYRCVKYHPEALQKELDGLPDSREVFFDYAAQEHIRGMTDIQRAARSLYLIKISFGSDRKTFATAPKIASNISASFSAVQERLRKVIIENLDFEHLIHTYDRPDALFYCDPPYRKHNLSQKSLKNIRGDLSGFCNYLDCADIRNDLRTSNIKIPSNAKKGQKQALDVSSLNILFTESQVPYNGTICQDSLIYAYRFQVVTGLRPGELMGLEWGDIDNDYIHIRRAINAKGITTNGKNEFAARDFPQTRYTRMLLESQQVYRVTPLDPHERVFGSTGQLCYRKRWGIYCRYNGIPYITPYELRHTFSSIYKNHFSNWVYEELVGHTHPGVNGVYMHPMDGDMDGVPALLDSLLDERLSLGRAKRMLLSNGQTK